MTTQAPSASTEKVGAAPTGLVVSVIVPVRNGGRDLGGLLDALVAQTLSCEAFEVVIGDDGSTDGALGELEFPEPWLRVVPGPPLNSYAARNRAAQTSQARVLAFCDSDCTPEPSWLERGLAALDHADVVGGLIRPIVPDVPTVWTLLDLDLHVDQERAVNSGRGLGGNLFLRRDLFDRLGGFDDSLPNTGDSDLVARCVEAGLRLVFASDAVVWHPTHNRGRSFLRKVWRIHRALGIRHARQGMRPNLMTIASIPILSMARSRRHAGRPLGLDRGRLSGAGVKPSALQNAAALGAMYLVLPTFIRAARFRGWWSVRRRV